MGQSCSSEEAVEGGQNTLYNKAISDEKLGLNHQDDPPWTFRSEQPLKTDFDNEKYDLFGNKNVLSNHMSSSPHIGKSIFGDDEWRLSAPTLIQHNFMRNENYKTNNKASSLGDIFEVKPRIENQSVKSFEFGKSIKDLNIESEEFKKERNNSFLYAKKLNDADIRVLTGTNLKELASIDSKARVNLPIESTFDNRATSIEDDQERENIVKIFPNNEMVSQPRDEIKAERISKLKTDIFDTDLRLDSFHPTDMRITSPKGKIQNTLENSPSDHFQTISLQDGSIYEGELLHNLPNGKGKETNPEGDLYIGSFSMGMKSGFGKLNLSNGDKYRGNFVNGKFNGMGTMLFNNGDGYIGEFKNGAINGVGTFSYSDGKVEKGFWRNSLLVHRQSEDMGH
jgi:hypothetical protein